MNANERTIESFYNAFARLDPAAMSECYADGVTFEDEVFTLSGKHEVMAMWGMLCAVTREKGADVWQLRFSDVRADDSTGGAHWDAHYRFSATGRIVDNSIDARFDFGPDGRIVQHRDSFDFWHWSRQALGAPGWFLGWSPMLRAKVREKAAANLRRYMNASAT
jgi:limonene-1,2-epoxide hydrolase